ncbi:phosphotransferase family protein [Streptomyces sp. MS19]|uniref:phosphotransferase family protein n=1 Tax=Streptomyces sp. MS19 TaxID=3385972 RepID=UPI0039A25C79
MTYERGLLTGEAAFFRAAGEGFLLMTECPGTSWAEAGHGLTPGERAALRRGLGATVARLHRVTGPRFGYPGARRRAVRRRAARAPARVRDLADAAAPALDEVTTPALVHLDLGKGDILLHRGRVGAVIDGERMSWGDPPADFASLTLLSPPVPDADLLAGYAAEGGRTDFDAPARTRMACPAPTRRSAWSGRGAR